MITHRKNETHESQISLTLYKTIIKITWCGVTMFLSCVEGNTGHSHVPGVEKLLFENVPSRKLTLKKTMKNHHFEWKQLTTNGHFQ